MPARMKLAVKNLLTLCVFAVGLLSSCSSANPPSDTSSPYVEIFCDTETLASFSNKFAAGDYEPTGGENQSSNKAHSGKFSCAVGRDMQFGLTVHLPGIKSGSYVEVSVWRNSESGRGKLQLSGEEGSGLYYLIGDPIQSNADGWEKILITATVPKNLEKLTISCYNPNDDLVYFDDLSVKVYNARPVNYDVSTALQINMDPVYLEQITQLRNRALERGIISEEEKKYVPAVIHYMGDSIPVKMRLKGDWTDHLIGDKWSFRVKVQDGYAIMGLKSFSIQHPKTRAYMNEWFMHQLFMNEGLLTTKYEFAPVKLNGVNLGIYALEEHFDKQLVEQKNRREGPILKFDEEGFWEVQLWHKKTGKYYHIPFYEAAATLPFKRNRTMKNESLRNQFILGQNLTYLYKTQGADPSQIFDLKSVAMWHALMDLGRVWHGKAWHNQRFYYNPITAKLELIAFDLNAKVGIDESVPVLTGFNPEAAKAKKVPEKFINYSLFNHPEFQTHYTNALKKLSSENYLADQIRSMNTQMAVYNDLLGIEFDGYSLDTSIYYTSVNNIRKALPQYQEQLKKSVAPFEETGVDYSDLSEDSVYFSETGLKVFTEQQDSIQSVLEIRNYHRGPLSIIGYSKSPFSDSVIKLQSPVNFEPFNTTAQMQKLVVDGKAKRLFFKIPSISKVLSKKVVEWPHPAQTHPRFELEKTVLFEKYCKVANDTAILSGSISLNNILFIPAGYVLRLAPGTSIHLNKGGGILTYSPVHSAGTKINPVRVKSSLVQNHGFQVLCNNEVSTLTHTHFQGLSNLNYKNWVLTGAVTFHKSEVKLSNCSFTENHCEDALNLFDCQFSMDSCSVSNTYADGFDGDFCKGIVRNSNFSNTGNDCLDFSGSEIEIISCVIDFATDKGISGGEASNLTINNCYISNTNIAVAAKDRSHVNVASAKFNNCRLLFAVYQKKDEYGPSELIVGDCEFTNQEQVKLVQTGNIIQINDQDVVGTETVNIDSLYAPFKK